MRLTADTNVFVYTVDQRDTLKQTAARTVYGELARTRQPLALQVVGEFQNALRRSLGMPPAAASQDARNLLVAFPTFGYDAACVNLALAHAGAGRFSYWDALLLAACSRAGVEVLLSEDMQDGGTFAGVRIINPFSADGLSPRAREILEL